MEEFYKKYPEYCYYTGEKDFNGKETRLEIIPWTLIEGNHITSTHLVKLVADEMEGDTAYVDPLVYEKNIIWNVDLFIGECIRVSDYSSILHEISKHLKKTHPESLRYV